jgi:hypothetical protein
MRAAAVGARTGRPRPRSAEATAVGDDQCAQIAVALHHSGMPREEIHAVLDADDPELIRRYMELHRERLTERLDDQLRELGRLQHLLEDNTDA